MWGWGGIGGRFGTDIMVLSPGRKDGCQDSRGTWRGVVPEPQVLRPRGLMDLGVGLLRGRKLRSFWDGEYGTEARVG